MICAHLRKLADKQTTRAGISLSKQHGELCGCVACVIARGVPHIHVVLGFVVVPFVGMDLGYAFFMPVRGVTPQQKMNGREQDGDSMNRNTLGIKPDAVTLLVMAGATNKIKTSLVNEGKEHCK